MAPEQAGFWIELSQFYMKTGHAEASLKSLEQGRGANPRNVDLAVTLCRAQIAAHKLDDAGHTIAELERLGLGAPALAWLEGEVALAAGNVSEARRKLLEATRKSPAEFAEAHFDLGRCYSSEGNYGAAEEQFRIASHSPAIRAQASASLAEVYLLEGQPERALALCEEIQRNQAGPKEGPATSLGNDPALLMLKGRAQWRLIKFDDAEKSFRAALDAAREPSRKADALLSLAQVSLSRRQALRDEKAPEAAGYLAAAQQSVAEAVKLAPENPSVALMDAQLANLSGDQDKAAELRKRAAASPAVAALLFSQILGPDEKDLATATELLAAHPKSAEVQSAAAGYFDRAGRKYRDQAIACARKAFDAQKTDEPAAIRLFEFLRSDGRADEAQRLASELADVPATKALGLALEGRVMQDGGKKEDAVQKLRQSIAADDQDWRAHFWLAGVYDSMSARGAELEGRVMQDGGKKEDAIQKLKQSAEVELGKALELDPVARDAADLLLQVLESEAKFDRVQEEIGKLAARSGLDTARLVQSAQLYERTGEWEKAAARWKQASETAPRAAQLHLEYAHVLDRLGRKDEALAEVNRAAELGPPSVPTARAQIEAYLSRGDRAKAEQLLLDAIKALPDDPTVYFLAAQLYQDIGAPSEAESWLKQLAERRKDDPEALALLADYFTERQRYDEAIRKYRDILQTHPDFAHAEYGMIQAERFQASRTEDPAGREALLKHAEQQAAVLQKQDPKSLNARMVTAGLLETRGELDRAAGLIEARGELDRAEEFLQAAVKEFDKSPAAPIALARLYLQREKFDEAEHELATALDRDNQSVEAQTLLARIHIGENRYKQALEDCQAALRYEPMNVTALNLSAQIKLHTGRGAEAVADLRKVVSLNPADRAALMSLDRGLIALKADGEALAAAKEGRAKNPDSADFCREYASVLCYLKRFDEAAAVCRAFLAKNTDNEAADLMLAGVLFQARAAPQAQEALKAAEQAAKDPRLFLIRAANVCSLAGDHERAIAYATRLAEQSPADLSAVLLRVNVLMQAGRAKEAAQVAADAQKGNPDSVPFLRQAVTVLTAAKQNDQAAALCAEFLKRRPQDVSAGSTYVELLIRSGRRDEALAEAKRLESVAGAKAAPDVTDDAERLGAVLWKEAPDNAQAWLAYAGAFEAQGPSGQQAAIKLYREALYGPKASATAPLRPLSGHVAKVKLINNLAYALAVSSFPTAAEKDRALAEAEFLTDGILGDRETAPGYLLDTVGWVKFARNKYEEAQQILALATSHSEASAETWYHYAMACAATGRAEEAVKAVEKAAQLDPKRTEWRESVKAEIARNQKKP